MKITSITCGKSIQVVEIGMPEQWKKLSVTADLDENDTPENAIADLKKMVDEQLQQPYFVAPKKRDKPKTDMVMLKKYEEAIRIGDVKTITEIENNFDVIT